MPCLMWRLLVWMSFVISSTKSSMALSLTSILFGCISLRLWMPRRLNSRLLVIQFKYLDGKNISRLISMNNPRQRST
uniref:Uncharacterized protein n=1 Tax=uncultured marine virus TaxID=186617 RepID=A0A0F7L7Q1_9VIRU|nr:hypothetical protein [uncultured marine virus]